MYKLSAQKESISLGNKNFIHLYYSLSVLWMIFVIKNTNFTYLEL